MKKTILLKHKNKVDKITCNVNLHVEIIFKIVEKFNGINKRMIDPNVLFNNVIDKY